jgi:Zn-dependent peptidase ImmA (M78 family)/transcriptional regulator with XRE-family HTH domain
VTQATFVPERLRLARELREWSQANLAREIQLTPAAVSQFESGITDPSQQAVKRMASVLGVPPEFFARPVIETHEGFFRSLRRTSIGHRRRARALAYIAHDLVAEVGSVQLPPPTVPQLLVSGLRATADELERIAAGARQELGVPSGPVRNVVDLMERHGIVVIRLPLDTADVDAFSLPFPDRPVVVLGADKNDRARSRFDASHELGHLVAHSDQVWGVKEVEQQAHAFAAAFLMPAEDIVHELPTRLDWSRMFDLKRKWQVSLAALLMRARTLGRMSEGQYLTAVKAASALGWRRVEPVPLGRPESPQGLERVLASTASRRAAYFLPGEIIEALADATLHDAEYSATE